MAHKNFVIIVITAISTILLSLVCLSFFGKNYYENREYPMWDFTKEKIGFENETYYNLLMIGDSRAKVAFIPKLFDVDNSVSINLALGGATPIEGYFVLKNYLRLNKKPKMILLSYAPFHFEKQDWYWTRTLNWGLITSVESDEVMDKAKSLNDLKIMGFRRKKEYWKYDPYQNIAEMKAGFTRKRWLTNKVTMDYLIESRGHIYFGRGQKNSKPFAETRSGKFSVSVILDYYLKETIRLSNEHGIKVFYYTMPLNRTSEKLLEKEYKLDYDLYLNKISKEYNINVLNNLYFMADTNFGDASHLYNGSDDVTIDMRKKIIGEIE
jgi:hypothetical protein